MPAKRVRPDLRRCERLMMRARTTERAMIELAARTRGQWTSEFIRDSALAAARQTLATGASESAR